MGKLYEQTLPAALSALSQADDPASARSAVALIAQCRALLSDIAREQTREQTQEPACEKVRESEPQELASFLALLQPAGLSESDLLRLAAILQPKPALATPQQPALPGLPNTTTHATTKRKTRCRTP